MRVRKSADVHLCQVGHCCKSHAGLTSCLQNFLTSCFVPSSRRNTCSPAPNRCRVGRISPACGTEQSSAIKEVSACVSSTYSALSSSTDSPSRSSLPGAACKSASTVQKSTSLTSLHQSPLSERLRGDDACTFVIGEDIWNNAFREACKRRSPQEIVKLAKTRHPNDLFERLQKEYNRKADESVLQKGFNWMEPVLRGLNFTLDVLDPISGIEPCASSVLAIVRMVATVSTSTCIFASGVGSVRAKRFLTTQCRSPLQYVVLSRRRNRRLKYF